MLLITGGTGQTGSEVVRALVARGERPRVFARDPAKAEALFGDAVSVVRGDFADAGSVADALGGAHTVFLSCADDPRRVAWEAQAIDAAARAGVSRIVKLSTVGAAPGAPVAFWDWHGQVEELLRSSGVPAVTLRASFSMANLLPAFGEAAQTGRLVAPAGSARVAMIDPRDVGAAAAAVLAGGGEDGATYELTGPAAITWHEVAAGLARAVGRGVAFVDVPPEAAREAMVEHGMPPFVADQVSAIFTQLRAGVADRVSGDVEGLTGSAPRSFAEFARDRSAAPVS